MANGVQRVAVLGVDPGTKDGLGWAVMEAVIPPDAVKLLEYQHDWLKPVLVESGVIQTSQMDPDDRSELWGVLDRLLNNNAHRVQAVAYERVHRHSGVHAAHLYGGQVAVIQHWCATSAKPWITVQVGAVKRFLNLRASGKDKRKAGVDAAHALGYTEVTDHNEADAVGIALAGIDQWKRGHNVFGNWKGN